MEGLLWLLGFAVLRAMMDEKCMDASAISAIGTDRSA